MASLFVIGCGSAIPPSPPAAAAQTLLTPDNAAFSYSDAFGVTVSATSARFQRPVFDGRGGETESPGARVRFVTDSADVVINLDYTDLVADRVFLNGRGAVLVNGNEFQEFDRSPGRYGAASAVLHFAFVASRTVEVVMPYGASVDFRSALVNQGSRFSSPPPRPQNTIGFFGDSVSQGYYASKITGSWPYLLAQAKGWTQVNGAYGGRQAVPDDAPLLASAAVDVALYLIGYNDLMAQKPLDQFRLEVSQWLARYRGARPSTRLYVITPMYSPNAYGALSIEQYRQAIRDAVASLNDPAVIVIEGLALADNDAAHFPDGIHPSDIAALQIRDRLGPLIR